MANPRSRSAPVTAEHRSVRKRARIVETASRTFAARPFHLVSMEEIALAAGVGKGTLYRYFRSKEALYLAILDEAFDLLTRRLDSAATRDMPPATALRWMVEATVETFARHLAFFRLIHHGDARLFLRKKEVVRVRREHIARLLADVLERGAQAGVFRKVDRMLGPSMLLGMVWGMTLNHGQELPSEVLAERVTDLYLHGILEEPRRPA
jgi:TetR/AcrR family fatty acid metabolism transcriptional regulator